LAPPIGERGLRRRTHNFKLKDGLRAIKTARDGGLTPAILEIIAKDGTVYTIYGLEAATAKPAPRPAPSLAGAQNPTDGQP